MICLILTIGVLAIAAGLVAAGLMRRRDRQWEKAFEEMRRQNLEEIRREFACPRIIVKGRDKATEQQREEE